MKLIFTAVLVFCVSAGAAEFNPVCKRLTKADWDKHLSICLAQARQLEAEKKLPVNGAKLLCDCVTDEYVNKTTCAQIVAYTQNPELRKQATKRNSDVCIQKLASQGY